PELFRRHRHPLHPELSTDGSVRSVALDTVALPMSPGEVIEMVRSTLGFGSKLLDFPCRSVAVPREFLMAEMAVPRASFVDLPKSFSVHLLPLPCRRYPGEALASEH